MLCLNFIVKHVFSSSRISPLCLNSPGNLSSAMNNSSKDSYHCSDWWVLNILTSASRLVYVMRVFFNLNESCQSSKGETDGGQQQQQQQRPLRSLHGEVQTGLHADQSHCCTGVGGGIDWRCFDLSSSCCARSL